MHKWITLILVTFVSFQLQAQHKKKISFYELDVIRGLFFQPNTVDPYTGTATDKHPNGKKRLEIPIKNGKVNGMSKEWAKNGQKIHETTYVNGVQNGRETHWYVMGQKKLEVNLVQGNAEGVCTEWYKNGTKKSEGNFTNGKENGEHKWWFNKGQIDQIVFYENGLAQGMVKNWYPSGKLRLESDYKNGLKDGVTIEWFENGQKQSEGKFVEGKEDGVGKIWDKEGKLVRENTYKFGKLIQSKNYLSGSIFKGDGYYEVFNGMKDFYLLEITGQKVEPRESEDITYNVDGNLLQIFNRPLSDWIEDDFRNKNEKELLEKYVELESKYISTVTDFPIEPKTKLKNNNNGKQYMYWKFVSPSSQAKEQKPRTVQEEHYVSFIIGDRLLSLYSVVTNNDQPEEIQNLLQRLAQSVQVKNERIDLNALAKGL